MGEVAAAAESAAMSPWEAISTLGREQSDLTRQIQEELNKTRTELAAEATARKDEIASLRSDIAGLREALDAERSKAVASARKMESLNRQLQEERAAKTHLNGRVSELEFAWDVFTNQIPHHHPDRRDGYDYRGPPAHMRPPYEYVVAPRPPMPPPAHHVHQMHQMQQQHQQRDAVEYHNNNNNSVDIQQPTRVRSRSWQDHHDPGQQQQVANNNNGQQASSSSSNATRQKKQRSPRASPNQIEDAPAVVTSAPNGGNGNGAAPKAASGPPADPEVLRALEDQILELCVEAPNGSILCANLPRLYYYKFRKTLDFRALGFMKMSQLLTRMDRIHYDGKHRAEVSRKMPEQQSTSADTDAEKTAAASPEDEQTQRDVVVVIGEVEKTENTQDHLVGQNGKEQQHDGDDDGNDEEAEEERNIGEDGDDGKEETTGAADENDHVVDTNEEEEEESEPKDDGEDEEPSSAGGSQGNSEVAALVTPPAEQQLLRTDESDDEVPSREGVAISIVKPEVHQAEQEDDADQRRQGEEPVEEDALDRPKIDRAPSWSAVVAGGSKTNMIQQTTKPRRNGAVPAR